jgi:hypothetical protein
VTDRQGKVALLYQTAGPLPEAHRLGSPLQATGGTYHGGMDDNSRRRRPNESSIGNTSNPRYPGLDPDAQRRSYGGGGAPDRYRPAPLNTSPHSSRSMGNTGAYSGYYQEPGTTFSAAAMPQNTLQYGSEYGQDTRQTQSFAGYNPSIMYNVPQTGTQSTVYDTTQQFPSRQPAGLPMMPTDVTSPYFAGEPSTAPSSSAIQPQAGSSSAAAVYQQSPADQRSMLQSYSSTMASMSGVAQTSPDQVMEDQDYTDSAEMGEAYQQYQSALREIFQNIRSGTLAAASVSLLNVSDWLLTKVTELGMSEASMLSALIET